MSFFNIRYREIGSERLEKGYGGRRGGLERIPESKLPKPCSHPEHHPPAHICIPQGMQYRHICPGCGAESVIRPTQVTL